MEMPGHEMGKSPENGGNLDTWYRQKKENISVHGSIP